MKVINTISGLSGCLAFCCSLILQSPLTLANDDVRLVVHIAVDQLRPDRINGELPGGIGRLLRHGLVYPDATLNHGVTNTCPGHAVMLTGLNPNRNGIVSNDIMDRAEWRQGYCVEAPNANAAALHSPEQGRSPERMQATTLGDWLKQRDVESRVYSLALKDRSAITMGGQQADGVFWLDRNTGHITSSQYYVQSLSDLPISVKTFNAKAPMIDGYFSKLPDNWQHGAGEFRPDDFEAEDDELSRVSPHPLNQGSLLQVTNHFYNSPQGDTAIIELAKELIAEEALGQRDSIDLLALSFAAVDTIGHEHGPFSAEVSYAITSLDAELGFLMDFLDETVGEKNYVVSLTADHGVLSLPEWRTGNPDPICPVGSGRFSLANLALPLYARLFFKFMLPLGNPFDLVRTTGTHLYVNWEYAESSGIDGDEVSRFVESYLEAKPYIREVWTPAELNSDKPFAEQYRHSYHPDVSGDLMVQNEMGCLIGGSTGTGHSTAWDYDRRVPLVFYGNGIDHKVAGEEAHSVDIGPTWANWLNVPAPADLDGVVLFDRRSQ